MLIFVDKRAPEEAIQNLRLFGKVVEFGTEEIAYEAVSCHPDIFFTQFPGHLIVAPNLPDRYFKILSSNNISFTKGAKRVGEKYPETAVYNAVVNEKYLVHNQKITDQEIVNQADEKHFIPVKQAYTRCNLVFLNQNAAITSDKGIEKQLAKQGIKILFVDPSPIVLPGFSHGFFGGACGIFENQIFIVGNLRFHHQESQIRSFIGQSELKPIELYDGPLFDGGAIFFL